MKYRLADIFTGCTQSHKDLTISPQNHRDRITYSLRDLVTDIDRQTNGNATGLLHFFPILKMEGFWLLVLEMQCFFLKLLVNIRGVRIGMR